MLEVVMTSEAMTCKVPVKSSPLTNQYPAFQFYRPFLVPNQQCQSTEEKIKIKTHHYTRNSAVMTTTQHIYAKAMA